MGHHKEHVKGMKGIKAKLEKIITTMSIDYPDTWIQSVILTLCATVTRCISHPKAPFYTELVAQTKKGVEMSAILIELLVSGVEEGKLAELAKIFDEVTKLHDRFMEERDPV